MAGPAAGAGGATTVGFAAVAFEATDAAGAGLAGSELACWIKAATVLAGGGDFAAGAGAAAAAGLGGAAGAVA